MALTQHGSRWWLIVPVCLVLVFVFIRTHLAQDRSPPEKIPKLDASWHRVETARGEIRNQQPIVGNCFICHAFWVSIPTTTENSTPRFAHANITLHHGKNDRCFNCHHVTDRNMYVADNGGPLFYRTPELLCGRCHGLIYNDWKSGTHGKWTGKFSADLGSGKKTFTCTECHDPHAPQYSYPVLAPPPTWPKKYIRGESHLSDEGVFSGFVQDAKPEEMF